MLAERTYYTILCDRCGADAFEDGDTTAWSEAEHAEYVLEDAGEWLIRDDKHFCEACIEWNDDEDELVVKPASEQLPK